MSDTQVLLSKIASLRQRLEQAQGLVKDADSAAASLARESAGGADRVQVLERQVAVGEQHNVLLDGSLRQMTEVAAAAGEMPVLPRQLTARARRLLEQGRALLGKLRGLADELDVGADARAKLAENVDPLALLYRETAAMADTALRMVQTFPDAPSVQLHLCKGLEAILGVVAERLATITAALNQRRLEAARVTELAGLLTALHAGQCPEIKPFVALAQAILAEAQQAAPLRFLHGNPEEPARFIACHSLTVAQVMARIVRNDPELRNRPLEPVLAALLHDAGMLCVPAGILAHPGPLDDTQRRAVESHTRNGAESAARLLPGGAWLAEAMLGHHERQDGTGYPDGLRELQIGTMSRLLAVCDVYAALCAPRPHRPARDPRTALTDTLLLAEAGALDPFHAERLLVLSFYPVGSVVELADGAVAVVVATPLGRRDLNLPARPVVALLTNAQGQPLPAPRHLDLAQCEGPAIVRTLPSGERRERLGRRYPEWAA